MPALTLPAPGPADVAAAGRAAAPLMLAGGGTPPCAVHDFTARLGAALGPAETLVLGRGAGSPLAAWRAIGRSRGVVANFPVVAWKRALLAPLAALAAARLRGRPAVVVLHEWASLHRLRRLAVLPALALASRVVMLSPTVRAQVAADPLARRCLRRAALAPMPPTLAVPDATVSGPLAARLAAARREGRLVVGHFGSIYAGKAPEAMLDVAAALKARGARPLLVYIGDFVRSTDGVERRFREGVAARGLADDVVVSGYVAGAPELYGLFAECDAFAYVFAEGLTARRTSVLACLQSGRPVVVSGPTRADEFDHHPRLAALVEAGALALMPPGAGADDFALRLMAVAGRGTRPVPIDAASWWGDMAEAVRREL